MDSYDSPTKIERKISTGDYAIEECMYFVVVVEQKTKKEREREANTYTTDNTHNDNSNVETER